MQLNRPVEWVSETKFIVDGLEFGGDLGSYKEVTTHDRVVILKDSRLLRQYLDFLAPHPVNNLLELGIWQGGSPLFYGLATDAKRVVALDIVSNDPISDDLRLDPLHMLAHRNPAIDEIIFAHNLGE